MAHAVDSQSSALISECKPRLEREIVKRVLTKRLEPVVGEVVEFEALPAALEAMCDRKTVGRTIVELY